MQWELWAPCTTPVHAPLGPLVTDTEVTVTISPNGCDHVWLAWPYTCISIAHKCHKLQMIFFQFHISDVFRASMLSLAHLCSTDLATEERRWEKEERRGRRLLLSFFVPSWSVRGASFLDHTYRGHHQNWPQQPRNRLEGWSRDLSGAWRALNSAR